MLGRRKRHVFKLGTAQMREMASSRIQPELQPDRDNSEISPRYRGVDLIEMPDCVEAS